MRWTLAFCALSLMLLGGCATYLSEKQDLNRGGGQSYWLQKEKESLELARARQRGLEEDLAIAREELAALQAQQRGLAGNQATQGSGAQNAQGASTLSEEEAARLKRNLNAEVEQKERKLQRLREELHATNREIEILSK